MGEQAGTHGPQSFPAAYIKMECALKLTTQSSWAWKDSLDRIQSTICNLECLRSSQKRFQPNLLTAYFNQNLRWIAWCHLSKPNLSLWKTRSQSWLRRPIIWSCSPNLFLRSLLSRNCQASYRQTTSESSFWTSSLTKVREPRIIGIQDNSKVAVSFILSMHQRHLIMLTHKETLSSQKRPKVLRSESPFKTTSPIFKLTHTPHMPSLWDTVCKNLMKTKVAVSFTKITKARWLHMLRNWRKLSLQLPIKDQMSTKTVWCQTSKSVVHRCCPDFKRKRKYLLSHHHKR